MPLNEELLNASKNGDIKKIQSLIKDGANVNMQDDKYVLTVLIYASQSGNTEVVDMLIAAGANVIYAEKRWLDSLNVCCLQWLHRSCREIDRS